MRVNRSFSFGIYKLYLKYTYPIIIAIGTNNIIYKRSSSYWIDLFSIVTFFLMVTTFAILLPVTTIIHGPSVAVDPKELFINYTILMVLNVLSGAFLHMRNRIKPVFNRLNKLPLDEVKKIKKSYLLSFLLYYFGPISLAILFILVADHIL